MAMQMSQTTASSTCRGRTSRVIGAGAGGRVERRLLASRATSGGETSTSSGLTRAMARVSSARTVIGSRFSVLLKPSASLERGMPLVLIHYRDRPSAAEEQGVDQTLILRPRGSE